MLTARQAEALDFIRRETAARGGVCPSYVEIGAALGLRGRSAVHRLVRGLEARGMIRRRPFCARSIEVAPTGDDLTAAYRAALEEIAKTGGPRSSRIAAAALRGTSVAEITSAPWPHVGAAVLQVQECGPASS